jgi:hypothetical protein
MQGQVLLQAAGVMQVLRLGQGSSLLLLLLLLEVLVMVQKLPLQLLLWWLAVSCQSSQ